MTKGIIRERKTMPRICSLSAVICLVLFVVCHLGFAQEAPIRLAIDPQEIEIPKTIWYGAYLEGKKVGYGKVSFGRKEHSGGARYSLEQTLVMKITSMGQKKMITSTEVFQFDTTSPYLLTYARHSDTDGSREQTVEMMRKQNGFDVILKSGAETETRHAPQIDLTLEDALTIEQWFRRKPGIGETVTTRILDIRNIKPGTQTIKILSQKSVIVDGVKTTYCEASLSLSTMEHSEILKVDQRGETLSVTLGDGLELRLEPEELARNAEYSEDLFLDGLAFIDKPLGDPSKIRELVVEVLGEHTSKIADIQRQSITYDKKTKSYILKIGSGYGEPSKATPEEIKENLKETIDYPVRHPQIIHLAKQAIGEARTPLEKVKRLLSFVSEYVKDEYAVGLMSVFDILSERRGDCTEHALLFTTLARAAGIPARQVYGLLYMGDDGLSFGGHVWNEVVIDGQWRSVDPALGQLEIDATHIRLPEWVRSKISFRLIAVNYSEPSKQELQVEVEKLLSQGDTIKIRRSVEKLYALGNIYEQEGNEKEAIRLYGDALGLNAWNLEYQLRLAKLLMRNNSRNEAVSKARLVYDLAEDEKLIRSAEAFLEIHGMKPTLERKQVKLTDHVEIVLVPLGEVEERMVQEARVLLEKQMGVKISIHPGRKAIGHFDRTLAWRYVSQVFESLRREVKEDKLNSLMKETNLTPGDVQTQEDRLRFIRAYLETMNGRMRRTRFQFEVTVADLSKRVQYNYSRLLKEMQNEFLLQKGSPVKGYLAITGEDLYDGESNFVFGLALVGGGYGVMSYHRFTAGFNGVDQNRPRLLARILKQALSSANFLLGIPRCSTPNCARAYPNSLQEHDQKSDELCPICRSRLDEYIKSVVRSKYIDRGSEHYKKGQYDQAIVFYNKAVEINPEYDQAYFGRGLVYQSKKELDLALSDYSKAIEMNPNYSEAYNNRGSIYWNKGNQNQAFSDYDKAIELNPQNAQAYSNRGLAFLDRKEFDKALTDYNKSIELNPENSTAFNNRGTIFHKKNSHDKALSDFSRALEIDPKYDAAYYNRGLSYHSKGELDRAIADYTKAIELNPLYEEAYNNRGSAYNKKGDRDHAIADYSRALEMNPRKTEAYVSRGATYSSKGDFQLAISDLNKALEISPENTRAYDERGITYGRKGNHDLAIADFNRALEIDPRNADVYNNRGFTLKLKGELDLAVSDFNRCIEINPKYTLAYINRGNTHAMKGNKNNACSDWKKACELGACENYVRARNSRYCE